jgi:hypothetical protein
MTKARRRAILAAAIGLIAGLAAVLAWTRSNPRERPVLLLLTSLPIAFGESFELDAAGSPLLDSLERRYRVRTIATSSASELERGRLLLMAHPLAQPAEDLVALDQWVRAGGRLLLLADPMLEWADRRPLGDPTRPPPIFMDTGLLAHWGLKLVSPSARGERMSTLAGSPIVTRSPGSLNGACDISPDGLVARCAIGKGTALIVADADFLDWSRGSDAEQGDMALMAALDSLDRQ